MARKIKIFDTTLRDGEQSPGCSMTIGEKLEVAAQLERLNVDIIEAGFAVSSPGDFESVREVSRIIKNCGVASLARAARGDIDAAYDALKNAAAPRIHIFLATSPLHMEYKLKMSPETVLEKIADSVKYARSFIPDIEFSAEDASRSDREFLAKACSVAVKHGATTINIPDTVGYCTPQEMHDLIRYLMNNVAGAEKVTFSAHNHNDLGLGVANSLSMILAGAGQVECTVNGIGERAGNSSLEEIVMGLATRPHFYEAKTDIVTTEIYKACRLVSNITGVKIHPTKPIVGANAFAHESGIHQHGVLAKRETYEIMSPESVGIPENRIVLGKHSGKHAFSEHLKLMGYDLPDDKLPEAFNAFKVLADKKKYVSDKDIEALLSTGVKTQLPRRCALENFSISCSKGTASASLILRVENDFITHSANGDGPIDAAFNAVNQALKTEYVLSDYNVTSVTGGNDALGESMVRLSYGGVTAVGRGVSTDVIESGILAYIDAVNKLK